jgi:CheY-like chemotaxis protein
MSPALRLQRLEALAALVAGFSSSDSGFLDDALDALVEATSARAAAAFANDGGLQPRAERRLGDPLGVALSGLTAALRALADRALQARQTLRVVDLAAEGTDGLDFSALSARCALCVPLATASSDAFAIVLLFDDSAMLDEETLGFVQTVAGITVLALDRHHARSIAPRSSGAVETSRGPELELYSKTIAQEILGPAGALMLQHDELRQIGEQLRQLSDASDLALGDPLAELGDVLREMGSAAASLRETASGLMSAERDAPVRLDLAELVSDALAPAREQLERRGIRVSERSASGCFVAGLKSDLSRIVQQLVAYAAEPKPNSPSPELAVSVHAEGAALVLVVQSSVSAAAEGALSDLAKPLSSVRDGASLALKLATEGVAAHGGHLEIGVTPAGGSSFRVVLPRADAAADGPVSRRFLPAPAGKLQRILLVGEEPLFSRSLRRGLRPHDVRIAGTASEAELLLLERAYRPDLVVCDVILPGTPGHVLHRRIRELRPELAARFVFVTGGALGSVEAEYLRASGCMTLFKPIDVAGLLELFANRAPEAAAVRTLVPSEPPS